MVLSIGHNKIAITLPRIIQFRSNVVCGFVRGPQRPSNYWNLPTIKSKVATAPYYIFYFAITQPQIVRFR